MIRLDPVGDPISPFCSWPLRVLHVHFDENRVGPILRRLVIDSEERLLARRAISPPSQFVQCVLWRYAIWSYASRVRVARSDILQGHRCLSLLRVPSRNKNSFASSTIAIRLS